MSELAYAMQMFSKSRLSTAISRYPTGRYGIVGSIPMELTEDDPRSLTPGARKSMVWETEQEVIDALLAIGVTRFQLADCSWYDPEHKPTTFCLENTEPKMTKWTGKPSARQRQRALFSGLDCLPGQRDLFDVDGEAEPIVTIMLKHED